MATRFQTKAVLVRGALLAALALLPAGCGGTKDVAAAQGAEQSPLPPPPAPTLPSEGAALKADLEALDVEVQKGLGLLAEAMKDFEADRRTWSAMDRSMDAARSVNKAVGARNKAVVTLYDTQVAGALSRFERKLKDAPGVYRAMAAERRRLLAESALDLERRGYLAMAELCEAAAVLCDRRHEEIFGTGTLAGGFESRPRRKNATALAETIDNMRKLSAVHDRWEETFAAYPTSLDDNKLSALFDHLSAYAEDLEAFTKGVEALKDAMKRKAEATPQPKEPAPAASGRSPAPTASEMLVYEVGRTADGKPIYEKVIWK